MPIAAANDAAISATATAVRADTLASGQASLSNIRIELIDLTPDDGQTPWIRFGSATDPVGGLVDATGFVYDAGAARQASWQGGILPIEAVNATSADGYAGAQAIFARIRAPVRNTSPLAGAAPVAD